MILRTPTVNENRGVFLGTFLRALSFPRRRESRFVRPQLAWIPAFAGMTEIIRFTSVFRITHSIVHRRTVFHGGHKDPSPENQSNFGISPAKHVLSDAEGTRRPQSLEFGNESHLKITIFKLGAFAPWREKFSESGRHQLPNHLRRPRKF